MGIETSNIAWDGDEEKAQQLTIQMSHKGSSLWSLITLDSQMLKKKFLTEVITGLSVPIYFGGLKSTFIL